MKFIWLFVAILLVSPAIHAQTWSWSTPPHAGVTSEVLISEIPEGDYHLVLYTFEGTKLRADDVTSFKPFNAGTYQAKVQVPAKSNWLALSLKEESGEVVSVTTEDVANEESVKATSSVEKAMAFANYYRVIGLDKNEIQANIYFRNAVITDASWLDQPDVLSRYYQVAKSTNATSDIEVIKNHLTAIGRKPKDAPEALLVQAARLAQMMGDTTLRLSLKKEADKLYPKNFLLQEEEMAAFKQATTLDQKVRLLQQFKSKYPVTDENRGYIDQMAGMIADEYAAAGNWEKVQQYVGEMVNPMTRSSAANSYAWTLSGESTDKPGSHYDIAEKLSASSISLVSSNPAKPAYLTPGEWARNLEGTKAQYSDTYALILYKLARYDEAIKYQLSAVQNANYDDAEMNERYAIYLEQGGNAKELAEFMEKIMIAGKATAKVKEIHKNYWTKMATTESLYTQYLRQLDARAHDLIEERVSKMWRDEDPVSFKLKDLQGNEVSLADYKGKTVVLDFWATWCGPCKASFPGMRKTVDHYASDKDVVFLFVDTWENPDNLEPRVAGFIRDNNYPFHVLLDDENKVVTDYKIQGIPTKYVIGPDQKIRFVSVGYSGNVDELVEEMKIMIEMARSSGIARS